MAEKIAHIASIKTIAPDVLEVDARMAEPGALRYRAGQFVSIRFPAGVKDDRRSYSISSEATRTDGFELLVKLLEGGLASRWFEGAKPGDALHFTGPMGFFTPDLEHAGDALFAATGSGIAAALPMIADVVARPPDQERGRVILWWGLRHAEDLYWRDRLDALAAKSSRFSYRIALSKPTADWPGERGHITEHVLRAAPALDSPVFYIVGNGDMIRDVKTGLLSLGVDRKKQIRTEIFYPASKSVAAT